MRYGVALGLMLIGVPLVSAVETPDRPLDPPRPFHLDSGLQPNLTATPAVVYTQELRLDNAAWMRVYFEGVELEGGSFIRLTSHRDQEVQELDAAELARWGNTSAYFNGDRVTIELIADPGTRRNRVVIAQLASQVIERQVRGAPGQCGICGGSDDRVPSDELWVARLLPAGCTASVYHPDSCMVSAGHCIGGNMVMEFNVPNSFGNCALAHPPIVDQFPVLQVTSSNGGPGDDWAVMTVGNNNVGQRPLDRYGELRPIATDPPVPGQSLDLTGYGVDLTCTLSQTQQTADGTINSVNSDRFFFSVDLRGGNSGSSLVRTDEIIGIATHCPCPNIATRIDLPSFEAARDLLCPPMELGVTALPFFDYFPDAVLDSQRWTGIDGADVSTRGINEPTPQFSMNLNGAFLGGEAARTAIMDTSGMSDLVLGYGYEAGGTDDPPDPGDDLIVEYLNSAEQWVPVNLHPAPGTVQTDYSTVLGPLPPDAQHPNFRVQFRCLSDERPPSSDDDWFVDNVCIGPAAFCADPFECVTAADCDDAVDCTVDGCDDGLCIHTPDGGQCDDGVACTADTCDADTGCDHDPDNAVCNDGFSCSVDVCDPQQGCLTTLNHVVCDDGNPCTDDTCVPGAGCQSVGNELCGGIGVQTVNSTDAGAEALGLQVCQVYVTLNQSTDNLLNVGFSNISTTDPAGFHQVAPTLGGTDRAPSEVLLGLFPELNYDSYVSIGLKTVPMGVTDGTSLDGDWDPSVFNNGGATAGGWYNANPPNGQGHPDKTLQVFVAQFVASAGSQVSGTMSVFFNDGLVQVPLSFACFSSCPEDFNGDGQVDAQDLAQLLGAWGGNPGHVADLNGDDVVNAADLAQLLGAWGDCP